MNQLVYFDLPSQPLSTGLIEFALQSSLTVVVDTKTIAGIRSSALTGPHSAFEALHIMLAETPLTFSYQEKSQSIIITAATKADAVQQPMPPRQVVNESPEEVLVTGIRYPLDYNTISNSQIYGTASVFNTARFISVLPPNLVKDQAPTDLNDLLKLSSGITPGDGLADSNDDFYIRGFPRYGMYVNGVRISTDTGVKQSPATIERVEILKGPSTLFYGQAEPGGIVNIVTKKPLSAPHQKLLLTGGDNNKQEAVVDLTGEAFADELQQWRYRVIAADTKQDQERDLTHVHRKLFAPSLEVTLAQNTVVDIGYRHQTNQQTREQGTIIVAPLGQSVDVVSLTEPAHQARPDFTARVNQFDLGLQHYFASGWSSKNSFSVVEEQRQGIRTARNALLTSTLLPSGNQLDPSLNFIVLDGISIPITTGTSIKQDIKQDIPVATIRSIFDEVGKEKTTYFKTLLDGSTQFMGFTHELSLGADWHNQSLEQRVVLERRNDIISLTPTNNTTTSSNPTIKGEFNRSSAIGQLSYSQQSLDYQDYGIFLLDNIALNDQWRTSFGGRQSMTTGRSHADNAQPTELPSYNTFSPEFGLRYEPIDTLALYVNYSEGLKTNYQLDDVGTTLNRPETSHQYELGTKMLLLNGTLVSTLAAYQIDKQNVVNIQFIDGFRHAVIDGQHHTSGIDVDFTYQITPNISMLGSLSLISPVIGSGENQGRIPALASKRVASTFLSYRFNDDWAKGWSINLGGYYVGKRFIDNANTATIGAFTTIDLGAAYEFPWSGHQVKIQLSAKNIADKKYLSATEGFIRNDRGAGRSLFGTLELTY